MKDLKARTKQYELGERRGWILHLLELHHPKPMNFRMLRDMLDFYDFPMSRRQIAEKVDFLCGVKFVHVFPHAADDEMTTVQQAKLIQRYCDSDGDMDSTLLIALSTHGVKFLEGRFEEDGVIRV